MTSLIVHADLIKIRSLLIAAICLLPQIVRGFDELSFDTIEHIRSRSDARERMINFNIYRSRPSVRYEIRETPEGSLEPTVKSIEFNRDMELTSAEADSIFKRIIAAGLFRLPESSEHRGMGNIWSIFWWVNGHRFELSYRRPPQSGVRKRVDDTVNAIARELGFDQIGGPAYATIMRKNGVIRLELSDEQRRTNIPAIIEAEGDRIPARSTTIQELVRNPRKFDGKRVSVVGFYHSEFEGYELRAR